MESLALEVFHRCMENVYEVRDAANSADVAGQSTLAPILRRSAYVLSVAAFDSYFHERGITWLRAHALKGHGEAVAVANYIRHTTAEQVAGPTGEGRIRLRLSYLALVSPESLNRMLAAAGLDSENWWLELALEFSTQPDRLKRLTGLVYDRRNQIAHEGDWSMGDLEFRSMRAAHLEDCVNHVVSLVEASERLL